MSNNNRWTLGPTRCEVCDASFFIKKIQEELKSLENWEVKAKAQLEKDLGEQKQILATKKCPLSKGETHNHTLWNESAWGIFGTATSCPHCQQPITSKTNNYGDKFVSAEVEEKEHQGKKAYFHKTCWEKVNADASNQIKSNQIKSNQIKSNQIKSNQIKSNQIKSNQIKSNQIKSNQIKSNQIQSKVIIKLITYLGF